MNEKEMIDGYVYSTFFYHEPVCDFSGAKKFLGKEMSSVMCDKLKDVINPSDIISVKWQLTDSDGGDVVISTTKELTEEQLQYIADWIVDQNINGIGREFEIQPFWDDFGFDDDEGRNETHPLKPDNIREIEFECNNYEDELLETS